MLDDQQELFKSNSPGLSQLSSSVTVCLMAQSSNCMPVIAVFTDLVHGNVSTVIVHEVWILY